jgi:hypothetical protein
MAILEKMSYPRAERALQTGEKFYSMRVDTNGKYNNAEGVARVIEASYDDGRKGKLLVAGKPVEGQDYLEIARYGGVGATPILLLYGDYPNHDAAAEGLYGIYQSMGVEVDWSTPIHSFLAIPEGNVSEEQKAHFLTDPAAVVLDPALRRHFMPGIANGFWIDKVDFQGEDGKNFPAFEDFWTLLKSEGAITGNELDRRMETLKDLRKYGNFNRLGEAWLMRALLDAKFSEKIDSRTLVTLDELISLTEPNKSDGSAAERLNLRTGKKRIHKSAK